jgi:hypothetical protein
MTRLDELVSERQELREISDKLFVEVKLEIAREYAAGVSMNKLRVRTNLSRQRIGQIILEQETLALIEIEREANNEWAAEVEARAAYKAALATELEQQS